MKKLIFVLVFVLTITLLLVGCGSRVEDVTVVRWIDEEAQVICWIIDDARGEAISCLPIAVTHYGE